MQSNKREIFHGNFISFNCYGSGHIYEMYRITGSLFLRNQQDN